MKFLDKHLSAVQAAIHDATDTLLQASGGEFFLDDEWWYEDGSGCFRVSLCYWEAPDYILHTEHIFDLRSREWTPSSLLLACLQEIFPDDDPKALVKLRNKLSRRHLKRKDMA